MQPPACPSLPLLGGHVAIPLPGDGAGGRPLVGLLPPTSTSLPCPPKKMRGILIFNQCELLTEKYLVFRGGVSVRGLEASLEVRGLGDVVKSSSLTNYEEAAGCLPAGQGGLVTAQ